MTDFAPIPSIVTRSDQTPRWMIWSGRALTGLFALFLLGGSIAPKLLGADVAVEALVRVGWAPETTLLIGLIELACLLLYLWPRTSIFGAVLTTALLGGALAAQMRIDSPLFSHTLFGVYLGLVMWGGLWLRDPALRTLYPWRRPVGSNH